MAPTTADATILVHDDVAANGITIDAAVESYGRHLRASNKSPNTIKTYGQLEQSDAVSLGLPTATARRQSGTAPGGRANF